MTESLLGVLTSTTGKARGLPRTEFDDLRKSPLKPHERVAVDFATALVRGDFVRAREFLAPPLHGAMPPEQLRSKLFGMFQGYASGLPRRIHFDPAHSHEEDWPDKKPGDVAWVYVSISGDDFNEAVTVIVAKVGGRLLIREIEWGKP